MGAGKPVNKWKRFRASILQRNTKSKASNEIKEDDAPLNPRKKKKNSRKQHPDEETKEDTTKQRGNKKQTGLFLLKMNQPFNHIVKNYRIHHNEFYPLDGFGSSINSCFHLLLCHSTKRCMFPNHGVNIHKINMKKKTQIQTNMAPGHEETWRHVSNLSTH